MRSFPCLVWRESTDCSSALISRWAVPPPPYVPLLALAKSCKSRGDAAQMSSWSLPFATKSRRSSDSTQQKRLRLSYLIVAAVATLFGCSLYLLNLFVVPQLHRIHLRTDLSAYDLGLYGFGPSKSHRSFDYKYPLVEVLADNSACDDRYTVIAPRGDSVAFPGPMIMDANGDLVWMKHNFGTTQNLQIQRYKGEDYLTYWEGEQVQGGGVGLFYMVRWVRQ